MELFNSCVELNNVPTSTAWSSYISEKNRGMESKYRGIKTSVI